MADPVQNTDIPQVNDSTEVQEQNPANLPSTVPSSDLQTNTSDVNNLRQSELSVKTGPVNGGGLKRASGTVLSIILVVVILVVAGSLFVASLRVSDDKKAKPEIAVGGEENSGLGTKKKRFKRNKKNKK